MRTTHCTCTTCRDFDFTRWQWKYIPVTYEKHKPVKRVPASTVNPAGKK